MGGSAPVRGAVLVLTSRQDGTADPVVHHLQEAGVPVVRLDPGDFPAGAVLDAELGGAVWAGSVRDAHRAVDLASVRSVYYRRPTPFSLAPGMSGPEQRWAYREARMGLGGVLLSLDCLWLNRPAAMSAAEYKPVQLTTAARCGLAVPPTLITSDPERAHAWARARPGPVVYKPLGGAFHVEESRTRIVYATRVGDLEELRDPALSLTAHCLQEWVDKDHEARVVIVGGHMFAVAIRVGSQAGHVDWRSDYASHSYEVVEVPARVRAGLGRYMHAFGLVYGAADFVISPDGSWTLLEVNPNGEWGWLAQACALPIAATIATLLEKGTP
ncbi:ATP-grasp ribosomal peptide maturase (plasmid) [Nocardiopsis sp. MT53]|uniref:ATP-grasp ribosomal peptide maturase n=1 Tax=Nocardiopsis changdeensis TaxID=2831969 RepID=A0A975KUH4_9ACTN|nr:ATP-grasp ribosomal peptide maturase [Nocardiopsis changdeensis]QYX40765.1 ATP-grasp ribosomal peptide maturase [Nocardiopsis sp. MT53]